ncbi:MAG: response regulator [Deltaproteobacteria bacterium]|nr:response regulator [Deltaproteobacteria bacterium]
MEPAMRKKRVLIVDDDHNVLKALLRLLQDEDYEVITADSAMEAKSVIERQEVHMVISDVVMPLTSGHKLLAWVRQHYPEIIRTMFTGNADLSMVMRAVNEGEIYRFFTKPWDPVELKLSIRLGLEKYDLEKERRVLQTIVRQQRSELDRIEEEFPGITAVKRDMTDAVVLDELSDDDREQIKQWCVRH